MIKTKRWKIDPTIFKLTEIDALTRIVFPDDCPYKGQYFYMHSDDVVETKEGYAVELPVNEKIRMYDPKSSTYRDVDWNVLVEQIGRYMRKKEND